MTPEDSFVPSDNALIMASLMELHEKVDRVLDILQDDEEEEEDS